MQKNVQISILCEIYGNLLTEKQYQALNDYYNNDMSLSEIAENTETSRQAVRDLVKKGEEKLFEYENILSLMKKMQENEKKFYLINKQLQDIKKQTNDKNIKDKLNKIQDELKDIL